MQNVKNTILDTLLSWVAPHLCSGCQNPGLTLCDNCKYDIISEAFEDCLLCLQPATAGICDTHRPLIDRAWCAGWRNDALQRLIGNYKFQNMQAAFRSLGGLLDDLLPALPARTVLVPVPTVRAHIRERGYDHIGLIVRYLAAQRHLPVARVVSRVSNTTQRQAAKSQRLRQAAAAFKIDAPLDPSVPYVIIDDVVTTGATITSIARLLREAGARHVWVAALARQPLDA